MATEYVKLGIYVTKLQAETLRREAFERRRSVSDLVRDMIDADRGHPLNSSLPVPTPAPQVRQTGVPVTPPPTTALAAKRIRDENGNRI